MRQTGFIVLVAWLCAAGFAFGSEEPASAKPEQSNATEKVPTDLPAAISQLGNERFEIREAATRQLSQTGVEAIAPLLKAAAGDNLEVTWRAIKALTRILDTEDEAIFDSAEAALEQLETSTNRSAARRAAVALETQPTRRWKRSLARFEAAGGWPIVSESDVRRDNGQMQPGAIHLPTYLVIPSEWKGGDAALIHLKRMDSVMAIEGRLNVYVVDGADVTPQALDELQNSMRAIAFSPRGKARLAVSFKPDVRGRITEVGTIEPDAAELTRKSLKQGDWFVKYDGVTLVDFDHLTRITRTHNVGDKIPVEVLRDGDLVPIEIELTGWKKPEKKPANAPQGK
jgi:hypothetical protein